MKAVRYNTNKETKEYGYKENTERNNREGFC